MIKGSTQRPCIHMWTSSCQSQNCSCNPPTPCVCPAQGQFQGTVSGQPALPSLAALARCGPHAGPMLPGRPLNRMGSLPGGPGSAQQVGSWCFVYRVMFTFALLAQPRHGHVHVAACFCSIMDALCIVSNTSCLPSVALFSMCT